MECLYGMSLWNTGARTQSAGAVPFTNASQSWLIFAKKWRRVFRLHEGKCESLEVHMHLNFESINSELQI